MERFERVRKMCVQLFHGESVSISVGGATLSIARVADDPPTWRASLDALGVASGGAYDVALALLDAEATVVRNASRQIPAVKLPALADTPTRPDREE